MISNPRVRQLCRKAKLVARSAPEGRGAKDGSETIPAFPPYNSIAYLVILTFFYTS